MSFLNNKEEVINIELTQHGKRLFSKGLFQPKYYAFFDDDIIYDGNYAGVSETNNLIETRILEESLYCKPPYILSEEEKLSRKPNAPWKADDRSISSVKSVNQYTPAWDIIVHEGFVNNYTKKNEILQVNMKDLYYTTAENADSVNQEFNFILLEINEENSISQKENYEIELYEVTDLDGDKQDDLKQLVFKKEDIYIKNGILLDNPIISNTSETTENNAEYFFNISIDKKIDTINIEEIKKKQQNIYAASNSGE